MDEANSAAAKAPPISASAIGAPTRNHFRNASSPTTHRWRNRQGANGEHEPLIRRRSLGPPGEENELAEAQPVAGGTVLGIHNLAIVMPQFLVSNISPPIQDIAFFKQYTGCHYFKCYFQDRRFCRRPEWSQYIPWQERCRVGSALRRSMYIGEYYNLFSWRISHLANLKVGACVARMVPPTRTEKEMRRRLGEMKLLKQQASPWFLNIPHCTIKSCT